MSKTYSAVWSFTISIQMQPILHNIYSKECVSIKQLTVFSILLDINTTTEPSGYVFASQLTFIQQHNNKMCCSPVWVYNNPVEPQKKKAQIAAKFSHCKKLKLCVCVCEGKRCVFKRTGLKNNTYWMCLHEWEQWGLFRALHRLETLNYSLSICCSFSRCLEPQIWPCSTAGCGMEPALWCEFRCSR